MGAKGFRPEFTTGRAAEARAVKLVTMKQRTDFLRAKTGRRYTAGAFVVQACPSPGNVGAELVARVGFTATRQLGGAVTRNRARRRLRALARSVLTISARAGHDYVLIARAPSLTRRFSDLENELTGAIAAVHAGLDLGKSNAHLPRRV
jgi:ribonuclease P protein component